MPLTLSRGVDQSIIIYSSDGPIIIMVTSMDWSRKKTRLTIQAPEQVSIVRAEIAEGWRGHRKSAS